jgi:hypothetical protein
MATKDKNDSTVSPISDFDPLKLIEDSINSGFDSSMVSEIDERDLNWCPNILTWITDPDYLGISTIYPTQLQVLLRLMGDVCPYCSDWEYYSKDFDVSLNIGDIQDRIQLLNFGKCPKCGKTRIDHYNEGMWFFPNEIDLLWGMRSGKSAIVGILASYHLHRFLKISDPASYYRLLKGSLLVMRFIALTAGQANESIWHQFTRSVETCAWFGQYHDFLRYHEKRLGVELNKWLTQSFGYVHKKITGYYIGASIDTSRGRTAIGSFFDEIGWWLGHDQSKRANPHETYQAYQKASRTIRNAAASRFSNGHYDVPTALIACASSTSSKTDYMMHLIKLAKRDTKRIASHKASWEVNPEFAANPDELKVEREANFKTYLRDYGSIPPFAESPFFDNEDAIIKLASLPIPDWKVSIDKGSVGYFLNASHVEKNSTIPYCLAIDLGHTHCGYAAALLKLKESDFTTIQVAGLFAIYPNKKRGEGVDMAMSFSHFIKKMCDNLPIRLIVYDQWQSKSQIQELLGSKIAAEQYSLTFNDFTFFRTQILQTKLEFPDTEIPIGDIDKSPESHHEILQDKPYLHFLWQMLSVSEVGKKIGKGDGHDDLFRAVVLGSTYLWDEDYRRDFEYRQGMLLNDRRTGKGRLVISAGSRSGNSQLFTTANSTGYNATVITPQGSTRSIGAVIGRTGK